MRTWVGGVRAVLLLALVVVCGGADPVVGQAPPTTDSVTIVPGPDYGASALYRALMGSGHRELWTTPIRVPVADLDRWGGGLVASRRGGGTTTRTLHLDGGDGRRYVFRSVDKTPRELLEDLEGTPIAAIVQDQVSSFHPTAAPVVAELLEAVGVLHPRPQYAVVPDDPRLGEFRAEFAGMLVLFEERPDDGPNGTGGFAGSRSIIQTDELLEELEENPDHRVDAAEVLRARLVDLLVGDRDRSHNNHLWAAFDEPDGGTVWRIVPRDRDQSLVRFDGVLKSIARNYDPRLVEFRDEYANTRAVSRNAWDIDRGFLVSLSRTEWDAVVTEVQNRISDDVLSRAVSALPAAHRAKVGEELLVALMSRRDRLGDVAEDLYSIVFGYADIHATDAAEAATIQRGTDGSIRVVFGPAQGARPTFDRVFVPGETREVRLYLRGGDDELEFLSPDDADTGIRVRVVGGGGSDRFVHAGDRPDPQLRIYDGGGSSRFDVPRGTRIRDRAAPRPFAWFEDERVLDWGSSRLPLPGLSFDEDRGLVVTLGMQVDRFGFLKRPYKTRTVVTAGVATGVDEPILSLAHTARDVLGGADIGLDLSWSGIELLDYFGEGNESEILGPRAFHRVDFDQGKVGFWIGGGDGERANARIGPVLRHTDVDTTQSSTFVSQQDPYGGGTFTRLGLEAAFHLDRADRPGTPSSGFRIDGGAALVPSILDVEGTWGEVHAEGSVYLSPEESGPTLALRAGGKHLWGPYPFIAASYVGGVSSVRGLREERYAGRSALYGGAEVRVFLARLFLLAPTDVGFLALTDVGRVWVDGEASGEWHGGYGGGLWFAALRRTSTVQVSVARSEGRTAWYFGLGFAY